MATKNTNTTTKTQRGTWKLDAETRLQAKNPDVIFAIRGEIDLQRVETSFGTRIRVSYWNRPELAEYYLDVPVTDWVGLEAKAGGEIDLDDRWEIARLIKRDADGNPVTWVNQNGEECRSYRYTIRRLNS